MVTSPIPLCIDMLKAPSPANGLKTALAGKLGVADQYSNADATALVITLINGADKTNLLYTTVDGLESRLESLEDAAADDCGSHCKAGEFVSQACTADQPTTCSTCEAGTFSLGGLPTACMQCTAQCPAGFYIGTACTATSDTVCDACDAGTTYETTACTSSSNRQCSACTSCPSGRFATGPCSLTANTPCQACRTCAGDFEVSIACVPTADTGCRFRAVGFRATMSATKSGLGTGFGDIDNWVTSLQGFPSFFSTLGASFALQCQRKGTT